MVIAWEFPGLASKQGMALCRRIGQISYGLERRGYLVSVIHKKQHIESAQFNASAGKSSISIYSFEYKDTSDFHRSNVLYNIFRPIITYFQLLFYGDFSGSWAIKAFSFFKKKIDKPDIIISFFTPRGPLLLANKMSEYFNVPYIIDFQDTFDEGLRFDQQFLSKFWMRKIIRKATLCVHVSPEWATRDEKWLKKKFLVLRHAIPGKHIKINPSKKEFFSIFYGGSLDLNRQSPVLFLKGLQGAIDRNPAVVFKYAGNNAIHNYFKESIPGRNYEYLGWLDKSSFEKAAYDSDCLLVIGWSSEDRMVVPSKLYDYMSYQKPILLAGKDSGSLKILMDEWDHPNVIQDSVEKVERSVLEGSKRDFQNFLNPENCTNVLHEDDLVDAYEKLILNALGNN